jgi:hypothetical protein
MRLPSAAAVSVLVSLALSACGHVPLTSIPSLMKIDFNTTNLAELRATILIPEEVRPLPGAAKLTIKVTGGGADHERHARLEEVTDRVELAALPQPAPAGMRMISYKLPTAETAKLSAFRTEILAERATSGRRSLSIGVGVDKFCNSAPLRDGPAFMTSYLRTSETRQHVLLTRDVDLKKLATDHGVDPEKALTPCAG